MSFLVLVFIFAHCKADYWTDRSDFVEHEASLAIGASLVLTPEEEVVNRILMQHKYQEYDMGYVTPSTFLPARHFFHTKNEIEKSEVFKFIQKIPKGASLHSHATALVSGEFVYNLTFSENLYGCIDNKRLKLHFFKNASDDLSCEWKSLTVLRNEDRNFDKFLQSQLTVIVDKPDEVYEDINAVWNAFKDTFKTVTPMLTYKPIFKEYFRQALQELYEDNVKYLEFRSNFPTLYDLNGNKYGPVETVDLYMETLEEFKMDHSDFMGARIIYAPHRSVDNKTVLDYVKTMNSLTQTYPDFVAGFDLVGQEDRGRPLRSFVKFLKQVSPETKFFFHAGETNWFGTVSDMNLIDAVILGTTRIGHGFGVVKHPFVMEEIKKRNIAVEICPISNQVLKLVNDLRNHPGSQLIAEGLPVVVCNDDPSFWGSKGLSYDWYVAFMGLASREADLKFLKQLANNSLTYSAMPADEKQTALVQWERDWRNFIHDVLKERNKEVHIVYE